MAIQSKRFLVTAYYYENGNLLLGHDTEDETDFTLPDTIKSVLINLNPNADVFDVAIDTDPTRITQLITKENK
jgi:hypothetical protein